TGSGAYQGTLPDMHADTVGREQLMLDVSYRVIADHLRCLTFALTDGAVPGNEGRGYVLRRILRRAVRYGRQYMGVSEPFLHDLVEPLGHHMVGAFPELHGAHGGKNMERVKEIIRDEEESFGRTFDRGLKLFREEADYARTHHHGRITGEAAFRLHDTFGFTIDLTEQMAEEDTLTIDIGEYERLMEEAREKARQGGSRASFPTQSEAWIEAAKSHGDTDVAQKYEGTSGTGTILGWVEVDESTLPGSLTVGHRAGLILDRTNFYAEQGGQVGDTGMIRTSSGAFRVDDTQLTLGTVLHLGEVIDGTLESDTQAQLEVSDARQPIMQNHTSTHILNWSLREILGDHVQQKGSLVDDSRTRFDFSHNKPLGHDEVTKIEGLCNQQIEASHKVYIKDVEQGAAREINTLRAVFGEKYPDVVRVVSIGADIDAMLADPKNNDWMQYSVEFCGGTHLVHSGEAERFVLTNEEGVAKGIRRIIGVSGNAAAEAERLGDAMLSEAALHGSQPDKAPDNWLSAFQARLAEATIPLRVRNQIRDHITAFQKHAKAQEKAAAAASGDTIRSEVEALLGGASTVGDTCVVVGPLSQLEVNAMRQGVDWVRNKSASSAVLLAGTDGEKVMLLAGMSRDLVERGVKAGDLIKEIAPLVGGKGGGRPDMAQGGGTDPGGIPAAVKEAHAWIAKKLGA
ncbi:MAG: alanine--tRNA ligase, partial [Phycisphaerae bacterium]